ncbi:MAG: helix-turn-helix domain-containing protein [Bacteroidota bacterium]
MKTIIIPLEITEFRSLLKEAIREEIKQILDLQQYEPLIKTQEAMKLLGVSKVTLLNWRNSGLIPSYKVNSRVYFKKSELLAAVGKLPNRKGRRK